MDAPYKTFALKVNICCQGCEKDVNKVLKKIHRVLQYEIDAEERKVTISGTVDPHTLIKTLKKKLGKRAELLPEESPPPMNNQKMQTAQAKPHEGILELTTTEKTRAGQPEHEHELELQKYKKRFPCNGCKEDGFGSRYRCKHCDYELHEECMFPKPTISHDFFKGYTSKFFKQLHTKNGRECCDACGKDIFGFVYHCKEKGLNFHPCCSNLQNKLCIDRVKFEFRDKESSRCIWCEKKMLRHSGKHIPGWSYVSSCERYRFHLYCLTDMVHEAWKKGAMDDSDTSSMALEKMDLQLAVNRNRNGGRGSEFWRIVKIFLKTIVGILLGDPTTIFVSVLVDLLSN